MDMFRVIDRKPKGHVLEAVGFVKNHQGTKNDSTKFQQLFN